MLGLVCADSYFRTVSPVRERPFLTSFRNIVLRTAPATGPFVARRSPPLLAWYRSVCFRTVVAAVAIVASAASAPTVITIR